MYCGKKKSFRVIYKESIVNQYKPINVNCCHWVLELLSQNQLLYIIETEVIVFSEKFSDLQINISLCVCVCLRVCTHVFIELYYFSKYCWPCADDFACNEPWIIQKIAKTTMRRKYLRDTKSVFNILNVNLKKQNLKWLGKTIVRVEQCRTSWQQITHLQELYWDLTQKKNE